MAVEGEEELEGAVIMAPSGKVLRLTGNYTLFTQFLMVLMKSMYHFQSVIALFLSQHKAHEGG